MLTRRLCLLGGIAGGLSSMGATAGVRSITDTFDAVVSLVPQPTFKAPVFATLDAAIASAPAATGRPFRIWIARGIWLEKLTIGTPNIHLIGQDRNKTIIRFTTAAGMMAPDGKPYGTYRTPTLSVHAPGFEAYNLTIENAFDGIAEMKKTGAKLNADDPLGPQAVALVLGKESNNAVLKAVNLYSHQDTLFVDGGISHFTDCLITGSYDFIFGAGKALFEHCDIRSRYRPDASYGFIAAPSTQITNNYGLVFYKCRLTRDKKVATQSVFLGRPWRTSAVFPDGRYGDPNSVGMAAFIDCWMDDHIHTDGWTQMWYTGRDGNPRTMLQPEDARFYEGDNSGPGGAMHKRGRKLSRQEAQDLIKAFA